MPFELHIALRYLLAKRKQAFISVISLISIAGRRRRRDGAGHRARGDDRLQRSCATASSARTRTVYVWKPAGSTTTGPRSRQLRQVPHVVGAAPAILGKALSPSGRSDGVHPDQRHRSGARAERDRHRGACEAGSLDGADRAGATATPAASCSAATSPARSAWRSATRSVLTLAGHADADGHDARVPRRLQVGRHFSSASTSSTRSTASCRSRSPSGCSTRTAGRLIQLRVDDIYRAPQRRRSRSGDLGDRIRRPGLDGHEPVAVLGADAREDRHLARDRPDRHGRRAEHRRLADSAGDGKAPRHRDPEDDGRERAERHDRSSCCRG